MPKKSFHNISSELHRPRCIRYLFQQILRALFPPNNLWEGAYTYRVGSTSLRDSRALFTVFTFACLLPEPYDITPALGNNATKVVSHKRPISSHGVGKKIVSLFACLLLHYIVAILWRDFKNSHFNFDNKEFKKEILFFI